MKLILQPHRLGVLSLGLLLVPPLPAARLAKRIAFTQLSGAAISSKLWLGIRRAFVTMAVLCRS